MTHMKQTGDDVMSALDCVDGNLSEVVMNVVVFNNVMAQYHIRQCTQ
jgi:hypothetical protein